MCGIAGEIRFDGAPASVSCVEKMTRCMASRGPDGEGVYGVGARAFGHRRLKIVDLSEHGHQPMVDSELGLGIVYNGMVYNYRALRRSLQLRGYRFFSTCDTEVLLKAYHAWGDRFVERLNGMFAFAIWERDSGRVVLGRDRLGIKPLYYQPDAKVLRFASTLPALHACGAVDTAIDHEALHFFLSWRAIVPAPMTILAGVRKLRPGHLMTVESDGTRRETSYWRPQFDPGPKDERRGYAWWEKRIDLMVRRATERRMTADVPVGVLLSGGVDSSCITGMLVESGHSNLMTFSIGFESKNGHSGNEFAYSDIVAERFKTVHHKVIVEPQRLLGSIEPCLRAMSEPMLHCSNIGFYLLGEEVSPHAKVVQTGQGADEVFAGYNWHHALNECANPLVEFIRLNLDRDHDEFREVVNADYVGEDYTRRFVEDRWRAASGTHPVSKALEIDTTVSLPEDPLKRVDNMMMAWGIEARVPFLDHELVELAARLPPKLNTSRGGYGKRVLKDVAMRIIPREVVVRPKGYFPVPSVLRVSDGLYELIQDVMSQAAARQRGLWNWPYVEKLLARPQDHVTPQGDSKLWQIATLEYWLQLHGVS